MIIGKNISLQLSNKDVLKDVSFKIKNGAITTFIGKSGAGKTSLLKCIANLHGNYQGMILLEEKDIKIFSNKMRAKYVGFVAQSINLFPHMTVLENCMHPMMHVLGISKENSIAQVLKILESLEIESLKNSYPSQISGGQQQRTAIARALGLNPEYLLLDEPTSALDPESRKSLEKLLKALSIKGIGIALSSHDMPFVKSVSEVGYFFENGKVSDSFDVNFNSLKEGASMYNFINHK